MKWTSLAEGQKKFWREHSKNKLKKRYLSMMGHYFQETSHGRMEILTELIDRLRKGDVEYLIYLKKKCWWCCYLDIVHRFLYENRQVFAL